MAKAYSQDLRDRVIDAVKRGAADAAAGAQDATLQERRLSPEISFNPCSRLQHFQRHCHVRVFYLSTAPDGRRPI
jgi:hypothetical protein